MTPKLADKLVEKYPKILSNIYLEVGDGWYNLIDQLCETLQFDTDNNSYPQVVAVQIKEKFGSLRFYVESVNDQQFGAISFAEQLTKHICEECGTMDNVSQNNDGWIKTLCDKCRETRNKKN